VLGIELTLPDSPIADKAASSDHLNLLSDMVLAGIVTCGFAVSYNTAWALVGMTVMGGMFGHGIRFLALENGFTLDVATFLGGLGVGLVSGWMARSSKTPVAVIAFAGAVTMMPGLHLYRALAGAMQLARQLGKSESAAMAATLGNAVEACMVIGSLALGLILGARLVLAVAGWYDSQADLSRRPA
jgi:uncharacterized membrane protein YjjB (DUF3815 family)